MPAVPPAANTRFHTDIAANGWVARLPRALRPYALLARLDLPVGVWLLWLPGVWGIVLAGASVRSSLRLALLFAVGSVAMRAAGCVVNDLWDRDIDRLVTRTAGRPLAAGMLRPRQALVFLLGLLMAGLAVLMRLNLLCWVLGVAVLPLAGLYPLAKRVTFWPQLAMGFAFGFGAPMGYAAASGRIDSACCALYAAVIVWDVGFDTIYAHQDREDDARLGIGSTALLFGERTRPFLALCYGTMLLLLILAGWRAGLRWLFFLPALAPGAALLGWQVWRFDRSDPALCLRLFQLNRETGLLIGLALLAGRL